jgi:nucleotide sugar dehydrogenase
MKITVVGMGKIGLPLAVQYARKGHRVFGTDINHKTVELINLGIEPFPGEANLSEYLKQVISQGNLSATLETSLAVSNSDVVVVVVPLFVDEEANPDFKAMDSATTEIAKGLKPGTLVSYETTLPVGTTRNRFAPNLEKISGLKVGKDFHLVFSPERVLTGRVFEDLRKYPKLVGGVDRESEERGIDFYSKVLDFDARIDLPKDNGVWSLGSAEASEMAKLVETTYRDVNIALANQFALFAESNGIDFSEVRIACNSQPFSNIHQAGIAVGGHCIPVYPKMYLWNHPDATVVRAAREANEAMPGKIVQRVQDEMGSIRSLKTVVLGAAYRGGVKETAFSGVFPTVLSLEQKGAKVFVHDPLYSDEELVSLGLMPFHKGESADIAIVQTDHLDYKNWTYLDIPKLKIILDGRNILDSSKWEPACKLLKIGIQASNK